VDGDELPAVRVSWQTAMSFCDWLSKKTGKTVRLPTEAEWEWAARAGSSAPFYFADALDADFSAFANLADKTMELFAEDTAKGSPRYTAIEYVQNPSPYEMWIPHTKAFDDGARLQVAPASYEPNAWGLCDMHGNVSEWTASSYRSYPFEEETISVRDDPQIERVVRGGSYRDRPYRATASHRLMYRAWQKVHDVGFRVVVEN
jgi:formylglycine-generating enzyme required for sulfatase activity